MDRTADDRPPEPAAQVLWIPGTSELVDVVDPRRLGGGRADGWTAVLLGLVVLQGAALGMTAPAWWSQPALVEETVALREAVSDMRADVAASQRVMIEAMSLDAAVRSHKPTGSAGDGPALDQPDEPVEELPPDEPAPVEVADLGDEQEEVVAAQPEPSETVLQPASTWARRVVEQMQDLLSGWGEARPRLDQLIADLEATRPMSSVLPQIWPADGAITSGYGWRSDPIHGTPRFHAGLDIANDRGTVIRSVAPGIVVRAETTSGYGRMVEIDHGYGILTRYAHCTTLRVRAGDEVDRGDFIATMGSTGKSTGPHLHFELRWEGEARDPLEWLPK